MESVQRSRPCYCWATISSHLDHRWKWVIFITRRSSLLRSTSSANPLGLAMPDSFGTRLLQLLWGRHRGLTFYAPIVLLTVPGWLMLFDRRQLSVAVVTFLVVVCVLLVNVFYPGMDRRMVDGAAAARAAPSVRDSADRRPARGRRTSFEIGNLARAGARTCRRHRDVCASRRPAGGYPHEIGDPLIEAVLPIWTGEPIPSWRFNERFSRNPIVVAFPGAVGRLKPPWQGLQFLPLLLAQAVGFFGLWFFGVDRPGRALPLKTDRSSERRPCTGTGPVVKPGY